MENVEKGSFQEEKERNKGENYCSSDSKFTGKKRGLSKMKSQKPKKTKKKAKERQKKRFKLINLSFRNYYRF